LVQMASTHSEPSRLNIAAGVLAGLLLTLTPLMPGTEKYKNIHSLAHAQPPSRR